jgi:Uma2 family endonuclease
MSYEEWLTLPEKPKAEWVRGVAIVSPPQGPRRWDAVRGLVRTLNAAFPHLRDYSDVGVRLPDGSVRAPDVMLLTRSPEHGLADELPLLAVEVISPESRTEDTINKAVDYAAAGIERYWIVDQAAQTVTMLLNVDGAWIEEDRVDPSRPSATVVLGEHGSVTLQLADVMPRP